jgi:hypothetical protein
MSTPKVTLDTNLLQEYWRLRPKAKIVEQVLALNQQGKIQLAVTARIHEDIPYLALSDKINELPDLSIEKTASIAGVGVWMLDRDMLGGDSFDAYWPTAKALAQQRISKKKEPPDWRDWDHLHAHFLLRRDVFLTWDEGILSLSSELKSLFQVVVMTPEECLKTIPSEEDSR